jgi:hypothetical protein
VLKPQKEPAFRRAFVFSQESVSGAGVWNRYSEQVFGTGCDLAERVAELRSALQDCRFPIPSSLATSSPPFGGLSFFLGDWYSEQIFGTDVWNRCLEQTTIWWSASRNCVPLYRYYRFPISGTLRHDARDAVRPHLIGITQGCDALFQRRVAHEQLAQAVTDTTGNTEGSDLLRQRAFAVGHR